MKLPGLLIATVCACVVLSCFWMMSCSSSTRPDYDYQSSAHIEPDVEYTATPDHVLKVGLIIQTPARSCWSFDYAVHSAEYDSVQKKKFTYVSASIKKLASAVCQPGLDTVTTILSIPFDTTGVYEVRYPQVSPRGLLVIKSVTYNVP